MSIDLLSSFLPQAEKFPARPLTLIIGGTFGPFYINFYASQPQLVGTYQVNPVTSTFTLQNHGLVNGTMVQVSALPNVAITDGLETGQLYFITNSSTNTFELTLFPGGGGSSFYAIVEVDNTVGGFLYTTGEPYNLTDHRVWAWVKHLPTDADNNLVLDLKPSITGASLGTGYDWRVTFTQTNTQTFNLTPSSNFWSLLLQFPNGTRSLLVDNSSFTIKLPTTHPNLGSS